MAAPPAQTVLIVEDDALARTAEVFALHQAGYRVLAAGSLAESYQWLAEVKPDLVLVDIGLPDGSGWSLARQLVAGRVPVVILTSRSDLSNRLHGLMLGVQDYLTKPLGLADLVTSVAAVLRRAADGPPAAAP
ncbi:MAG: response regulator transcription factor [Anaerolineales bacterium]|nr:response regulator transcription factor [Anaerolineales bacterium]